MSAVRPRWSAEELDSLSHLYAIGAPVAWIAKHLGRHPEATKSKVRHARLLRNPTRYNEFLPLISVPGEEWKEAPVAPGYFVSSCGRVVSMRDKPGLVMTPDVDRDGYRRLTLMVQGRPVHFLVSRLVLTAFVGMPPSDVHHAAHWNGDTSNNSLSNLRWATPAENCADKVLHGTQQRGERHPAAKATDRDVVAVKQMIGRARRSPTGRLARGESQRIAEEADVSIHLVHDLSTGNGWSHVQ